MNGGRQSHSGPSAIGRSPPWPIRTDGGDPEDDPPPENGDRDPTSDGDGPDDEPAGDRPGEESDADGSTGTGSPDDGPNDHSEQPDTPPGSDRADEPVDRQSVIRDQREEIHRLREQLRDLEDRVDRKSVDREDLEGRLERYVRWRQRRGYARNWGPYLVLLYGMILTLAAFQTPHLYNGWTILAMIVVWLSTLGLYALMLIVGWGLTTTAWLGAARSAIERTR
ncbi:hypothetical protein [Halococcoides cellulosivorans]|uniref:hypothetical protein n=1 Tax=Halococcoides cellulosivorans TaxID=1679096 RepID=UPI00131EFD4B|nr:hypothetical protein [Halococcoides cellulosivorans]